MWRDVCRRLLYPPDLGSEGKEVVDLETEAREAVGLYIKRDQFPDRLFAPPKRTTFLPEGRQPDLRQGNAERDLQPGHAHAAAGDPDQHGPGAVRDGGVPVHRAAVRGVVHLLRAAVQHAGRARCSRPAASPASASGRRSTCCSTTLITPWQMLWGKLLSGLRVSSVLTSFLLWPVLLACVMPLPFWYNLPTMAGYFLIVALDVRDDGDDGPVLLDASFKSRRRA